MTKVQLSDFEVKTSQPHTELIFTFNKYPSPLDLLENAVAACIGKELLKEIKNKKFAIDTFSNIVIFISNEKINIHCKCSEDLQSAFKNVVFNCYICSKLLFEKNIIFKNDVD